MGRAGSVRCTYVDGALPDRLAAERARGLDIAKALELELAHGLGQKVRERERLGRRGRTWTVSDRCESSTTLSCGASLVNSVSNCSPNTHRQYYSPGTPGTVRGEGTCVARISSALHARLEWRLDLLLHKQLKVDVLGKEWVLLDRLCAGDAESEGRVAREEAGQERARVRCDLVGEFERVREDLRAGCQGDGGEKKRENAPFGTSRWCSPSRTEADRRASRRATRLVECEISGGTLGRWGERTKSPPVDGLLVAVSKQQLGREVLWCAAESCGIVGVSDVGSRTGKRRRTVGRLGLGHVKLAESKVAQRDVTAEVDEDVLGLEVPFAGQIRQPAPSEKTKNGREQTGR